MCPIKDANFSNMMSSRKFFSKIITESLDAKRNQIYTIGLHDNKPNKVAVLVQNEFWKQTSEKCTDSVRPSFR